MTERSPESIGPHDTLLAECGARFQDAYALQMEGYDAVAVTPGPRGLRVGICLNTGDENALVENARFLLSSPTLYSGSYAEQVAGDHVNVAYTLVKIVLFDGDTRQIADIGMDTMRNSANYYVSDAGEAYENHERKLDEDEVWELAEAVSEALVSPELPHWLRRQTVLTSEEEAA